jgi:hypothetical protein
MHSKTRTSATHGRLIVRRSQVSKSYLADPQSHPLRRTSLLDPSHHSGIVSWSVSTAPLRLLRCTRIGLVDVKREPAAWALPCEQE